MDEATEITEAAPEEKKRRGRVPRAKPLAEVEADRKAEEARKARTVGRAPTLMEAEMNQERGNRAKVVTCRVLNKGEGRIHTGEIDETTRFPSFYAAGEHFDVAETDALTLERRGYAERVRA